MAHIILPKNFSQKCQINYQRRQTNFQPSSWSYESIESICNQNYYAVEDEEQKIKKMEEEVRCMLENEDLEPLIFLELIDDIHRLGMSYKFQESTAKSLYRMTFYQSSQVEAKIHNSLHSCALHFRFLRLHGYPISTDIFERFKDKDGSFSASLATDISGMLSLYEASFLAFNGESTLDKAREFTSFHLMNMIKEMDMESFLRVSHALELPLHNRMQRSEARWNIEMYGKQKKANQILHKLAILDFNKVQSQHKHDLQILSRWWRDLGLANKLSFARDRLMESFFSAVEMVFEPQFNKCRIGLTKVITLIMVLDDIYDVYGSPEELQLLTDAVDKWDINSLNILPDYMKLYFLALFNTINDLAYDELREHGQLIISHLRKVWGDLCKAFLREAKWCCKKHIPKFDEYLNHGWTSSSGVVLLTHAYFLTTPTFTDEALNSLSDSNGFLRFPSTIFRLSNDLSSSEEDIERGEVAKAVSCYMHETGASDEVARAFIKKLIDHNWKMMNREITYNTIFDNFFIETSFNLARIATCYYQYGDVVTTPTGVSVNRIKSVIIEPVQLVKL